MADLNIIGNIKADTVVNWTADATVYTNQQMLISTDLFYAGTDQPRFKLANGVDTWVNLDYIPEGGDTMFISYFFEIGKSFADLTDYFIGQQQSVGMNENQAVMVPLPAGTVIGSLVTTYVGSTFPTSENSTLSLVTDVGVSGQVDVLSTTLDYQTALPRNDFRPLSFTPFTILEGISYMKLTTPAWVTNPLSANIRVTLILQPS